MPAHPSTSSSVFISNPAELTTENTESSEVKPLAALDAYHILSILRHPIKHFRASLKFHPPAEQAKFPFNPPSSVSSVSFDSLAPARLALRANLRLLHLAFPKRSIVVKSSPVCPSPAFTLIELLVTVTVIAILAGITLAAMGGVNQKATRDKTKAEVTAISNALEQFKSVRDDYPTNSDTNNFYPLVMTNDVNSIQPFFIANKIQTSSSNQLLDSYGNAYLYKKPGTKNPASFDVFSRGRDGLTNTSDDIGNW
jgi:general secretion pathway protein G